MGTQRVSSKRTEKMKNVFDIFYSNYLLLFAILICLSIFIPSVNIVIDFVINVLLILFLLFTIFDLLYFRKRNKKKTNQLDKQLPSERKRCEFEKDIRDNLN